MNLIDAIGLKGIESEVSSRMKGKYTKLFLIGNGFDRWQGLPTSYDNFRQYYFTYILEITKQLRIKTEKDKAGNITTLAGKGFTGTTILYLDQVAPVLSIDYGDGIVDTKEQRIFYKEDANLKIIFKGSFLSCISRGR